MTDESASSAALQGDHLSTSSTKVPVPAARPAGGRKSTGSSASSRSGGRHRLTVHLLIGILMTSIALFGYSFLGPSAQAANRVDLRQDHLSINISAVTPSTLKSVPTRTPVHLDPSWNTSTTNAASIRAEMDELSRRISALNAANAAGSIPSMPGGDVVNNSGPSASNPGDILSILNQTILTLHNMTANTGSASDPTEAIGQNQ